VQGHPGLSQALHVPQDVHPALLGGVLQHGQAPPLHLVQLQLFLRELPQRPLMQHATTGRVSYRSTCDEPRAVAPMLGRASMLNSTVIHLERRKLIMCLSLNTQTLVNLFSFFFSYQFTVHFIECHVMGNTITICQSLSDVLNVLALSDKQPRTLLWF